LAREVVSAKMAHRRVCGGRMAVRWQGEAVMRCCSAVPSSYVAVADQGGAPGSGKVLSTVASFFAPLLLLSSLGLVY